MAGNASRQRVIPTSKGAFPGWCEPSTTASPVVIDQENRRAVRRQQIANLDRHRFQNLRHQSLHDLVVGRIQRAQELLELRGHPSSVSRNSFSGSVATCRTRSPLR